VVKTKLTISIESKLRDELKKLWADYIKDNPKRNLSFSEFLANRLQGNMISPQLDRKLKEIWEKNYRKRIPYHKFVEELIKKGIYAIEVGL